MDPEINELAGSGELPLAFRMLEHLPSISASLGFGVMRGSNTILRGGFMDDRRSFTVGGKKFGGPGKLGGFEKGALSPTLPTEKAYYGRRGHSIRTRSASAMFGTGQDPVVTSVKARRATRLANAAGTSEGKMAFGKGARVNNITARPRALTRINSLTGFNASNNTPFYSPFQFMAQAAGKVMGRSAGFKQAVYGSSTAVPEEQMFQRGMVSMMTAGRKADLFERKAKFAADGTPANRAGRKVIKAQEQVRRLSNMNNPLSVVRGQQVGSSLMPVGMRGSAASRLAAARAAGVPVSSMGASSMISYTGLGASGVDDLIAKAGGQKVGLTGNLLASAGSSQASRFVQGYGRGALGMMDAGGLTDDAMRGAKQAVSHIQTAIQKAGIAGPFDERVLKGSVIKNLGGFKNALSVATKSKQGAAVLGMRTAMMAIPGLNVLATASLVYDLGKMGGEIVKSGINLAKDAAKSMKGSIDKPVFGMGYKDNEIAATSRARGVMAIQNSRLNARSMLGSEGSMMAAHFG